jgi:hypothetical protein
MREADVLLGHRVKLLAAIDEMHISPVRYVETLRERSEHLLVLRVT